MIIDKQQEVPQNIFKVSIGKILLINLLILAIYVVPTFWDLQFIPIVIMFKVQCAVNAFGGLILVFFKRTSQLGGGMLVSAFVLVLLAAFAFLAIMPFFLIR
jgi:hypothetical protein